MLSTTNDRLECPKALLVGLIRTVELIVDTSVFKHSVFHLSSSRNHLHARVKAILKHGAKIRHHLIFSQPSFAAFDTWLEQSLSDCSLLATLQSRRNDLEDLYAEWAFLRNQVLVDTFLDVLRVLSTRDVAPFLKILATEASLQLNAASVSQIQTMPLSGDPLLASLLAVESTKSEVTVAGASSSAIDIPFRDKREVPLPVDTVDSSLCRLELENSNENVIEGPQGQISIPSFSYSYNSPVSSPPIDRVQPESLTDLNVHSTPPSYALPVGKSLLSCNYESATEYETLFPPALISRKKSSSDESRVTKKRGAWNESFLESDGMVLPPAIGHFPTPRKGQTLTSFLTSLSDNLPDLDRENAHFNVSEALISAFERIKIQKFQEKLRAGRQGNNSEEDPFGTVHKQTTNVPGSSKSPRRQKGHRKGGESLDITETEESEREYWRQQPRRPPPSLRKKPRGFVVIDGHDIAPHTSSSLTSSDDDDFLSSSFSAENVALNLLKNSKVKDNQLPPASELQWLVSELEAPQALLPLPKGKSASESESDYSGSMNEVGVGKIENHIRLRGNLDWAPPRPQIIFTVHPPPTLNILLKTQRCRCAGCGTRVDVKYASTFRYCHYLGRYFCTGCHTGKRARLPQMIIHQWDFSPYPVSNFSATLLEKLQSDPVYNVLAINSTIYKKVKMNNFRNYRIQLGILKDYIDNCKSATALQEELKKFPQYYSNDVDLYSLEDLVHLRFSSGPPIKTKEFVSDAMKHVLNCVLCKELGFICEICNKNDVLFPFQINRVSRCSLCSSCFHLKCFSPGGSTCPKCLRISARRSDLDVQTAGIPDSMGVGVPC